MVRNMAGPTSTPNLRADRIPVPVTAARSWWSCMGCLVGGGWDDPGGATPPAIRAGWGQPALAVVGVLQRLDEGAVGRGVVLAEQLGDRAAGEPAGGRGQRRQPGVRRLDVAADADVAVVGSVHGQRQPAVDDQVE